MPSKIHATSSASSSFSLTQKSSESHASQGKYTLILQSPKEKKIDGLLQNISRIWNWILRLFLSCWANICEKNSLVETKNAGLAILPKERAQVKNQSKGAAAPAVEGKASLQKQENKQAKTGMEASLASTSLKKKEVIPLPASPQAFATKSPVPASIIERNDAKETSVDQKKTPISEPHQTTAPSSASGAQNLSQTAQKTSEVSQPAIDRGSVLSGDTSPPLKVRSMLEDSGSAVLPSARNRDSVTTALRESPPNVGAMHVLIDKSKKEPAVKFVGCETAYNSLAAPESDDMRMIFITLFSHMFEPPLLSKGEAEKNRDKRCKITKDGFIIPLDFCKEKAEDVYTVLKEQFQDENYEVLFDSATSTIIIPKISDYRSFLEGYVGFEDALQLQLFNLSRRENELEQDVYEQAVKGFRENLCEKVLNAISEKESALLTKEEISQYKSKLPVAITKEGLVIQVGVIKEKAGDFVKALIAKIDDEGYDIRLYPPDAMVLPRPKDYLRFFKNYCGLTHASLFELLKIFHFSKELDDRAYNLAVEAHDSLDGSKSENSSSQSSPISRSPKHSSDSKKSEGSPAISYKKWSEKEVEEEFARVDSACLEVLSKKVVVLDEETTTTNEPSFSEAARAGIYQTPPPVVGKSAIISEGMAHYLMKSKKSLIEKSEEKNLLTNALAALSSLCIPIAKTRITGHYEYRKIANKPGEIFGEKFGSNCVRPIILSAGPTPNFQLENGLMSIIKVEDERFQGEMFAGNEIPLPEKDKLKDKDYVAAYDVKIRKHMIHHLIEANSLPALKDIPSDRIMNYEEACRYCEGLLKNGDKEVDFRNRFLTVSNQVISLEALFNLYREQLTAEFKALNSMLPQGMVYAIDPPSAASAKMMGGVQLLNRLQALAFRWMGSWHALDNVKMFVYHEREDKPMLELFKLAVPGIEVRKKMLEKEDVANLPTGASPPPHLLGSTKYEAPKGAALVLHSNPNGVNLPYQDFYESFSVYEDYGDAAVVFDRNRPDFCSRIISA